jgi:mitochondrial chaperone BCS1
MFELSATNPLIQNAVSLILAGAIMYMLKSVPMMIFNKIIEYTTTTVNLTNYNISFYNFLEWFEKSGYKKYSRSLQVTNGRWGYESEATLSAGVGTHFIKYKGKWALISLVRESGSQTEKPKDYVFIKYFGFDQEWCESLIAEVNKEEDEHKHEYKVFMFNENWQMLGREFKRDFKTVYMKNDIKEKLFETIEKFQKSKNDYIEKGIPYRLVIMLYGPPGTGKTSLVRALASKYEYNIAVASNAASSNLLACLKTADKNSIILLEDVDSISGFGTRVDEPENDLLKKINPTSKVLNALDGIGGFNNSILIMTTNHLEKIDPAILRPGRTDLILEIPKLKKEDLEFDVDIDKNEFTGAELQQYIRNK